MAEGNGVDLGAIYQLLSMVAQDVRELKQDMRDVKKSKADRAEMHAEFAGLRQTIAHYHASVLGHGILISEFEARLRRVEDHLDLPPMLSAE